MFTLWYSVLSWKEYREVILDKVSQKLSPSCPKTKPSQPTPPPPPPPVEPPKPPRAEPPKPPQSVPKPIPPPSPPKASLPPKLDPPAKPPRSPSPHPLRTEAFEDIEYEDEESDEEDEDSVVDSVPPPKPAAKNVNDFINVEKNQQQRDFGPQRKSTMVDAAVLEKLEAGFKKLEASDSKSLLKKYLSRELFDKLKTKKTSFGSTLLDVIQSGLENHDSGIGIYAPDADAYSVFADLFDPIIEDYHGGFKKSDKHPPKDWGDVNAFGNLDPAGEFVVSTRVRCGRSLEGYPFNPCLTEEQYKEMEQKVSSTLSGLEGELKGTFYPLTGMSKEVQQKLIDDHFLFKEGDRFLQAANACRFWPTGRGIFHNDAKTFLVWCNEEDHLRIISMQMGGDLGQVYRRLVTGVNDIEKRLPFSHSDRFGFLTFCPTNLGTTVRASVHIKVPKLAANKAKLDEVAAKFNLQVRGTRGEHTEAEGGVYDISNKRRMGLTEFDAVKEMYDGISEIIKMEKEL
ncbi:arginine kinase isoform X1 [Tribolium madens]|uniref:arginine kinase isoform X1 n=2 Tax=Tribolium madens TaxID=41895 RepID=UPI001CF74667|nr:arginine kinase isoform X1 [Tribolium madens]